MRCDSESYRWIPTHKKSLQQSFSASSGFIFIDLLIFSAFCLIQRKHCHFKPLSRKKSTFYCLKSCLKENVIWTHVALLCFANYPMHVMPWAAPALTPFKWLWMNLEAAISENTFTHDHDVWVAEIDCARPEYLPAALKSSSPPCCRGPLIGSLGGSVWGSSATAREISTIAQWKFLFRRATEPGIVRSSTSPAAASPAASDRALACVDCCSAPLSLACVRLAALSLAPTVSLSISSVTSLNVNCRSAGEVIRRWQEMKDDRKGWDMGNKIVNLTTAIVTAGMTELRGLQLLRSKMDGNWKSCIQKSPIYFNKWRKRSPKKKLFIFLPRSLVAVDRS